MYAFKSKGHVFVHGKLHEKLLPAHITHAIKNANYSVTIYGCTNENAIAMAFLEQQYLTFMQ